MAKKLSLAELMGSSGAGGMQLSKLHEVLGHATPDLPRNAIGRHRLVTALHQRFGNGFRALPGVSDLMKQFDGEVEFEKKVAQLKAIRYAPTSKKEK